MRNGIVLCAALLLIVGLVACGNSSNHTTHNNSQNPTTPKFLVAVDDSGAGNNVNVFPINATTGALGTVVSGSPFNLGINNAMTIVVHPNGHFVYAADTTDGSIHQWNVNESTGVPTEIAAKVVNESGTFFQPNGNADSDNRTLVITPDGKYLYSANGDATVGAYSIGANGALTHIADVNIGACSTGAITANNSYVWVTDTCFAVNTTPASFNVFTLKIGANGSVTETSSIALTGVLGWLWSIQINPTANFLYVGDDGGNAQIFGFKVAADGSLTQLTLGGSSPQFQDDHDGNGVTIPSSDCRVIDHSPDGKFFYWTDDDNLVHTLSVNTTTGAIAELPVPASPFELQSGGNTTLFGADGQIVVDVTGKFVYAAQGPSSSNSGIGGVLAFTRDSTTGALSLIGNAATPTANSLAQAIGIVR